LTESAGSLRSRGSLRCARGRAGRALARRPAYTSLVLVTLAIGIGATTAVFSAIDTALLRPLSYPDSARLVFLN
jgi:hypothetical protein